MDRESFQKLLANAFALQQSHIDGPSLSAILEVGRSFSRGEVDVDRAMHLIGERVRNAPPSMSSVPASGAFHTPATDTSALLPGADQDDRVSGAFLSQLASTLSVDGDTAISADVALDLVLQEIVSRASLVTHASGAIIALVRGEEMLCRASTGPGAPPPGAYLNSPFLLSSDGGLIGEVQVCDDTQSDSHVDAVGLGRLGIRSFAILPLLKHGSLVGLVELFSATPGSFRERDTQILQTIAEEILININSASEHSMTPLREDLEETVAPEMPASAADSVSAALAGFWISPEREEPPQMVEEGADREALIPGLHTSPSMWAAAAADDRQDTSRPGLRILPEEMEKRRFGHRLLSSPIIIAPFAALLLALGWMIGRGFWHGTAPANPATQQSTANPSPAPAPLKENAPKVATSPTSVALQAKPPVAGPAAVSGAPAPEKVKLLHRIEPQYPEAAKQQDIQGAVVLEVEVRPDGGVQDLSVVSGNSILATAATDAVRRWRFVPQIRNGQGVPFHIQIKVHFVLR